MGLCSAEADLVFILYKRLGRVLVEGFQAPLVVFRDLVWEHGQGRLDKFLTALAITEAERQAVRRRQSLLTFDF